MDSSLSSFQDDSTGLGAIAVETPRCARCVSDKKGCDRILPCSRCVEANLAATCVYTGAIQTSMRGRYNRRPGTDDTPIAIPKEKRRRRGRGARGHPRNQARARKFHDENSTLQDNWFRDAPEVIDDVVETEPEKSDLEFVRTKIYNSYSDIVTHLPVEIYRSTTFIRALDSSYLHKSEQLDLLCRDLQHIEDVEQVSTTRSKIHQMMIESDEDRNEAIVEVAKLQTLVASHIAVLSADLETSESRVAGVSGNMEKPASIIQRLVKNARNGHSTHDIAEADDGLDVPIDEDEPIYCYCQRVSFGKMIACENEHCEGGEWFHFQCLGWTVAPRGKWWCKVCADAGMGGKKFVRRQEELEVAQPASSNSPASLARLTGTRTLKKEQSLSHLSDKSIKVQRNKQR